MTASGMPPPRSVRVGGRAVAYAEEGDGREAVVLVHGFGGDRLSWMLVQPRLADRGMRTVALDLPGHGASDKAVGRGDYAAFAEVALGAMDALGLARAHMVGHSMGGGVCVAAALAAPERVRSLTLVAPAGLGNRGDMEFLEEFVGLDRREQVRPLLAKVLTDVRFVGRQVEDMVVAYKRTPGVKEALRTIADALFLPDGTPRVSYRDRLAELRMPVRMVWGEADRIVPAATADGLPASMPVVRVPGMGHAPHLEAPGIVVGAVLEAVAAAG